MKFTEDHEWLRAEGDDTIVVGITEHAAKELGDIVFVELPEPEAMVAEGDEVVVIESVKAASDILAPVSGEIVEINAKLTENPALVNADPLGAGVVLPDQGRRPFRARRLHGRGRVPGSYRMTAWTPTGYQPDDFANRRHIGPSPTEIEDMLRVVGAPSLDALIDETVPASIRQNTPLSWAPLTEAGLLQRMREVAAKNRVMTSLIGQGYHGTVTPPAIQRNILENPAWYTAYTPYQPEIAQGRLEALLNFQTMVADLTGLPVANASLLDEATAAAEAMTMAERSAKSKARAFFVASDLHPQTKAVIRTRAEPLGIEILESEPADLDPAKVFGAIFSILAPRPCARPVPGHRPAARSECAGYRGDPTSSRSPSSRSRARWGRYRSGLSQRFGVPRATAVSCRLSVLQGALKRSMPGRIVGVSIGQPRQPCLPSRAPDARATHPSREGDLQRLHGPGAPRVMASMYAVFHGHRASGDRRACPRPDAAPRPRAEAAGARVSPDHFFDTITVEVGVGQAGILASARAEGLNFRRIGHDRIGISLDETTDEKVLLRVLRAFGIDAAPPHRGDIAIPESLVRTSDYLTHPVFHMNRAESEMMRYMRRLSDRDLALDRAMIPLGSCTMKLNAAAEMMPITWPEFGQLHPFAPATRRRATTRPSRT
jgi:glycine dehydrogenase